MNARLQYSHIDYKNLTVQGLYKYKCIIGAITFFFVAYSDYEINNTSKLTTV